MTNNIAALKKLVSELSAQHDALGCELDIAKQMLAIECSAFHIGDRVINKRNGKICEVTKITAGYGDGTSPKMFGRQIRKDGKPGLKLKELWGVDSWTLV